MTNITKTNPTTGGRRNFHEPEIYTDNRGIKFIRVLMPRELWLELQETLEDSGIKHQVEYETFEGSHIPDLLSQHGKYKGDDEAFMKQVVVGQLRAYMLYPMLEEVRACLKWLTTEDFDGNDFTEEIDRVKRLQAKLVDLLTTETQLKPDAFNMSAQTKRQLTTALIAELLKQIDELDDRHGLDPGEITLAITSVRQDVYRDRTEKLTIESWFSQWLDNGPWHRSGLSIKHTTYNNDTGLSVNGAEWQEYRNWIETESQRAKTMGLEE